MKNLRKTMLLLVTILASGSVMATGLLDVNVIPGKNERELVSLSDTQGDRYMVELTDENGELVYIHHIKHPGNSYQKIYDFAKLDDGVYHFLVILGDETLKSKVTVKDGNAQISNEKEELAPYFKYENGVLDLTFLNFDKKTTKFLIYSDGSDELSFEEMLSPQFAIHKAFDLSKLKPGNYRAVILEGDQTYDYEFRI
jgi:hypothetical protein